jgi:hypothetical protein
LKPNAFVFQLKRPCVLIKTLWRFILNAKVFEKNAKEVFQKEKTAPQSLAKGLYNAAFLTKHPFY